MPFESLNVFFYLSSIVTIAVSVCEIFIASKNGVTLKTGLRFVQGHWKWHYFIDLLRVSNSVP